jgi:hypothetical protein
MALIELTLLLHTATTLAMTGIIWFVQVVHYPLFASTGAESFSSYEIRHAKRTGWVVGPLMCLEAASALALTWIAPRSMVVWTGLALLVIIWLSTFLLQVPLHRRLSRGFDGTSHRALVRGNWIRTVAWTARSVASLWMVIHLA